MADSVKDKKLAQLIGYHKTSVEHPDWQRFWKEWREDNEFFDGEQLDAEQKAVLLERGQPEIVINKILPKINNLMGAHRLSKARMGVVGRAGRADEELAKKVTDGMRYIQEMGGYEFEEGDMFDEGIKGGIGWMETLVDEDELGNTRVINLAETTESMFYDPYSKRYDLADARYIGRTKWVDLEDAILLAPKKKKELEAAVNVNTSSLFTSKTITPRYDDYTLTSGDTPIYVDPKRKRVKLIEIWYRERKTLYWENQRGTMVPHTSLASIAPGEGLTEEEILETYEIEKVTQKVVHLAVFTENVLISDDITPHRSRLLIGQIPFTPFFCYRNKKSRMAYGVIRQLKDPQKEINKRRSKAMHILNTKTIIMDEGAVDDVGELKDEAARPDGIIVKKQGKELSIETDTNLANTQFSVMQESSADITDISGVYDEAVGKQTNARSGKAIKARQNTSNQNSIPIFSNLRRTRLQIGKLNVAFMQLYYTDEMHMMISGEERGEDAREVVFNAPGELTLQAALFDVTIEDMEINANVQAEQFEDLVMLAQAGMPIPPQLIIKASKLRDKQDLLRILEENPLPEEGGSPTPPTQ